MAKYMDSENFKHFWNNILKPNLLKKVDKVSGKGLSTNDFTDTYKNAIGSLQDSVGALNTTKVDKVIGKDLSTNDFTNEYKDLIVANKDAISKLKGFIYPCTAQALEEMSQEQQAELYTQGYRAIKTENNGTVVLLGLASDGSLEWLGCNRPRGSLLDNGDFAIAQAGYGGTHGATVYAADRWTTNSRTNQTYDYDGGLKITSSSNASSNTIQKIASELTDYITLAVEFGDGSVLCDAGKSDSSDHPSVSFTGINASAYVTMFSGMKSVNIQLREATSLVIKNVRLLAGSYTQKTLPPWEAPDYTVELVKCMRYFRNTVYAGSRTVGSLFAISSAGSPPMRVSPTATITIISPYGTNNISPTSSDSISYSDGRAVYANLPSVPEQYDAVGVTVQESADL